MNTDLYTECALLLGDKYRTQDRRRAVQDQAILGARWVCQWAEDLDIHASDFMKLVDHLYFEKVVVPQGVMYRLSQQGNELIESRAEKTRQEQVNELLQDLKDQSPDNLDLLAWYTRYLIRCQVTPQEASEFFSTLNF